MTSVTPLSIAWSDMGTKSDPVRRPQDVYSVYRGSNVGGNANGMNSNPNVPMRIQPPYQQVQQVQQQQQFAFQQAQMSQAAQAQQASAQTNAQYAAIQAQAAALAQMQNNNSLRGAAISSPGSPQAMTTSMGGNSAMGPAVSSVATPIDITAIWTSVGSPLKAELNKTQNLIETQNRYKYLIIALIIALLALGFLIVRRLKTCREQLQSLIEKLQQMGYNFQTSGQVLQQISNQLPLQLK